MRSHQKSEKMRNRYGGLTTPEGKWNSQIRLLEENLDLPLKVKKPALWSVWNDLFHPDVSDGFITLASQIMWQCKQHFFLILTKRPERMVEYYRKFPYSGFPNVPNLGFGTTVELPKYRHRIKTLLQVPAAMHFVSLEPLLGEISLCELCKRQIPQTDARNSKRFRYHPEFGGYGHDCTMNDIDWVILGCESGPRRRPMEARWAELVIRECKEAKVPVFFKQVEHGGKVVHAPTTLTGQILQFPNTEGAEK